jgi:hypothetical protein
MDLKTKMACCFVFKYQVILSSVIIIIFSLYGEFLFNKFKLDDKYPKVSPIINRHSKLQFYYLNLNLFLLSDGIN